MNFQRINYFLTFCESMHFTNAAKELSISQPALAKAIGILEDEMGTRLVRREGRNTHLTQQGIYARKILAAMMAQVNKAGAEIEKAFANVSSQVRLAVGSSLSFTPIASFLAAYNDAHPSVHITIIDCESDQCADLLLKGKVDCLIVAQCDEINKKAECIKLYEECIVFTVPDQDMEKSNNQHLISAASDKLDEVESVTKHIYSVNSRYVEPIVSCSQLLWTQQLIKAGVGIGVVPNRTDLIKGVVIFENQDAVQRRVVSAAIPVGRSENETVARFHSMLREFVWS